MDAKGILLVDDSAYDVELTLAALGKRHLANGVAVARDGEEALEYLFRRGAYANRPAGNPVLVMLDLKMPKIDGLEVLRQIRADANLKTIPVAILTSSREEQDIAKGYSLGVNAYVVKPVEFGKFLDAVEKLGLFWAVINEPPPAAS